MQRGLEAAKGKKMVASEAVCTLAEFDKAEDGQPDSRYARGRFLAAAKL